MAVVGVGLFHRRRAAWWGGLVMTSLTFLGNLALMFRGTFNVVEAMLSALAIGFLVKVGPEMRQGGRGNHG